MSQIAPMSLTTPAVAVPLPKLGNPAVVGLAGFGLTTLMLQVHNLGYAGIGPVVWLGLIFGGVAQLVAGLQEQKMGNNFGYCAFSSYGAFWIALCGILLGNKFDVYKTSATDLGWFLVVWTAFSVILWGASLRISKAMFATFTLLIIGFVLLDVEKFTGNEHLAVWAGAVLTLCALGAWYMMAAIIYRDLFGRDILPVGKPIL